MSASTDRILSTHTGSLPRPRAMLELVMARERGEPVAPETFEATTDEAVHMVVERQREIGIDIVGDGEMGKPSYATYVKDRLTGFADESEMAPPADLLAYPSYAARIWPEVGLSAYRMPACCGEVAYVGGATLERDLARLGRALEGAGGHQGFVTAASPGVSSLFLEDHHYFSTERDYLWALGEAMRVEYERIVAAGFILQLDCPDLAAARHTNLAGASLDETRCSCPASSTSRPTTSRRRSWWLSASCSSPAWSGASASSPAPTAASRPSPASRRSIPRSPGQAGEPGRGCARASETRL